MEITLFHTRTVDSLRLIHLINMLIGQPNNRLEHNQSGELSKGWDKIHIAEYWFIFFTCLLIKQTRDLKKQPKWWVGYSTNLFNTSIIDDVYVEGWIQKRAHIKSIECGYPIYSKQQMLEILIEMFAFAMILLNFGAWWLKIAEEKDMFST